VDVGGDGDGGGAEVVGVGALSKGCAAHVGVEAVSLAFDDLYGVTIDDVRAQGDGGHVRRRARSEIDGDSSVGVRSADGAGGEGLLGENGAVSVGDVEDAIQCGKSSAGQVEDAAEGDLIVVGGVVVAVHREGESAGGCGCGGLQIERAGCSGSRVELGDQHSGVRDEGAVNGLCAIDADLCVGGGENDLDVVSVSGGGDARLCGNECIARADVGVGEVLLTASDDPAFDVEGSDEEVGAVEVLTGDVEDVVAVGEDGRGAAGDGDGCRGRLGFYR
jgi:hypothetical protein